MSKKRIITLIICLGVILSLIIGSIIYLNFSYPMDTKCKSLLESNEYVTVSKDKQDNYVFTPVNPNGKGFIFYPGGNVEYTSYAYLMNKMALNGYQCILLKLNFDLAVLEMNAADGICEQYEDVNEWYIGGHSLGGAMASEYVYKHPNKFSTLILLAAYSTNDLKNVGLSNVYSFYGSNDQIMNKKNYEKNLKNYPEEFKEIVIDNGNHCNFGMYGHQKGDGDSTLSPEEQIDKVINEFAIS